MSDQDLRSCLQGESHAHGMHPAERCMSHIPLRTVVIIFLAFILNNCAIATIKGLQALLRAVLLQQFALEVVRQRPHLQRASECVLSGKAPLVPRNKLPYWYTLMSH